MPRPVSVMRKHAPPSVWLKLINTVPWGLVVQNRIAEQVTDKPQQMIRVTATQNRWRLGFERDLMSIRQRNKQLHTFINDQTQVDLFSTHCQLSRVGLGEDQQIFDKRSHSLRRSHARR